MEGMDKVMSIFEIENSLRLLLLEKADKTAQYDMQIKDIDAKMRALKAEKEVRMGGYDYDKIKAASMVLNIRGLSSGYYDASCIDDAINDILNGCAIMKERYFGSKHYSGWTYQREDHKYGYGPKHGSIVFSVELRNPKEELTAEDAENCLYYLNVVRDEKYRALASKAYA